MPQNLNITLPAALQEFIETQASDTGLYTTPDEYLCALIRQDMEARSALSHVQAGLEDMRHNRLSEKSILDISNEA